VAADPAVHARSHARHAEDVRRYYDHNSRHFERFGQGGASFHRAVWGPGVATRAAAFHHVDDLILAELRSLAPANADGGPRVLDLGCGVGASLLHLAARLPIDGHGITISARQAERAAALAAVSPTAGRVNCRHGDYLSLPADLAARDIDLAFAIESFVHSPDPARFFCSAAQALRSGGKLLVCDDFLTSAAPPARVHHRRWLDDFRHGWRVGSLLTADAAAVLAAVEGLVLTTSVDLTPHLELRRPRDRATGLLLALLRPFRPRGEYWRGLRGGHALQLGLGAGLLQYRLLTFQRRP
jgi:cyclopropane fatty-acyl-phospholipid synthase-like methyltransferase